MPTRARHTVLVLTAVTVLAGCHHGNSDPNGPSSIGVPSMGEGGSCVGEATPVYEFSDDYSCIMQGGDWLDHPSSSEVGRCSGNGPSCDYFSIPTGSLPERKEDCGLRVGCAWRNADGTLEVSVLTSGSCTGEKVPCSSFRDRDGCGSQVGCRWTTGEYCDNLYSFDWTLNSDCGGLNYGLAHGTLDPRRAQSLCSAMLGCTWADGDGLPRSGGGADTPTSPVAPR